MLPRKPHTKSRRGCIECKRRHTKCDEQHPVCSTCSRLEIACTWRDWKPQNRATPSEVSSEVSTPGVIHNFSNISKSLGGHSLVQEDLAIDELKLLHHFTTNTFATLDSIVSQQDIWRDSMVKIGFEEPFLLRGILAISALHLATLHPDSEIDFAIQASNHYVVGLRNFRDSLQNVNEKSAVAVFAFSTITVVYAFSVARIHTPQDPIADFLNCIRLIQGVNAVLSPHHSALLASELGPILENGAKGGSTGEIPEILQLKTLVGLSPDHYLGEAGEAYKYAVDLLHTVILEAETSGKNQPYISLLLTWPALLPPTFLSSLYLGEPASLIVLAHFAALLGYKQDFWWILGWNGYIVNAVESKINLELRTWLSWPKKYV